MIKSRGLIVYRKTDDIIQYLILQAAGSSGHWMPPKGRMEHGENDLETAYRETWEESGLPKEYLEIHEDCQLELNYFHKDKPKQVLYWLAKLAKPDSKIKLSHEHKDFKWVTLMQAGSYVDRESKYAPLMHLFEKSEKYLNQKI